MSHAQNSVDQGPFGRELRTRASPIFLAVCLVFSASSASAADWSRGPSRRFAGSPEQAARAYLYSPTSPVHLSNTELSLVDSLPLGDLRTVRFEQRYKGLAVVGKRAVVRIGVDGVVRSAMVDLASDLVVSTTPAIRRSAAMGKVSSILGQVGTEASAELEVLPTEDGGELVWRVGVMLAHGLHVFLMSAHTGRMISDYSAVRTILGRVYDLDPIATPEPVDRELRYLHLSSSGVTPPHLSGRYASVSAYVSGDLQAGIETAQIPPNSGENYLYDPAPDVTSLDDPFAEVNAYFHTSVMAEYLSSFDRTSRIPNVITGYAPESAPWLIDSAFFDGKLQIILGRGTVSDYAYDADVIDHEYAHFWFHYCAPISDGPFFFDHLGLSTMPGSIEEGAADYFAGSVVNDAVIGEATLGPDARDLTAPVGRCPNDLIGEVHHDGRLVGTAAWKVRQLLGPQRGDSVIVGAITSMPYNPAMADFARAVVQTAKDLEVAPALVDEIDSVMIDRGMEECERVVELQPAHRRVVHLMGLDRVASIAGGSCTSMKLWGLRTSSLFQFAVKSDPTAAGLRLNAHVDEVDGEGPLQWSIYGRSGESVRFHGDGPSKPPVPTDFDYRLEDIGTTTAQLTVDATSDPPFQAGEEYFFVLVGDGCPSLKVTVETEPVSEAQIDAGPDSARDAEVDSAAADAPTPPWDGEFGALRAGDQLEVGGGCACEAPGSRARSTDAALLSSALLLAAALIRRRWQDARLARRPR